MKSILALGFPLVILASAQAVAEDLPTSSASAESTKFEAVNTQPPGTKVVYQVTSKSGRIISARVSCAAMDEFGSPLGTNHQWASNIGPHAKAYGTMIIDTDASEVVGAECRITDVIPGK